MTIEEYERRIKKCEVEFEKCIELAGKSKRGYEYWENKRGFKAFINRNGFLLANKIDCKIASEWLKSEANYILKVMEILAPILKEES